MSIMQTMMTQFRKPRGWLGRLAGVGMNVEHAKLWRWGLTHVAIEPDATVLDVGCGGGKSVQVLALAAPCGQVYGLDYSEEMVRMARRINRELIREGRVEIQHGTVSALPFPDATFDLVTGFETYYFWPNLPGDLREIRRVLKPGGTLLITNEGHEDERFAKRNRLWAQWSGIEQLHTPEEHRAFLTEAGYITVETITIPEKNWITAVARKP
jgi:ubiquinone/menaquinone biosynthesis C-methylase UbiE